MAQHQIILLNVKTRPLRKTLGLVAHARSRQGERIAHALLRDVHRGATPADRERGAILAEVPVKTFEEAYAFAEAKSHGGCSFYRLSCRRLEVFRFRPAIRMMAASPPAIGRMAEPAFSART